MARIESFEVFISVVPAVVKTFEVISTASTWNPESSTKAASLLLSITQFEIFMALVVVEACLGYTKGLTVALQSQSIDICTAYREANVVNSVLILMFVRLSIKTIIGGTTLLCSLVQESMVIILLFHGVAVDKTQRDNVPAETPEEYYRRYLTIPFLDHILSHMETCFSDLQQKAVMALQIIPSVILQNTHQANVEENYSDELVDFFKDDLPSPSTVDQEIKLWFCKWNTYVGDAPNTPTKALSHATECLFPNVHKLLRLICTLPVTSCECERSVIVLRRLKTYLRTTMGQLGWH